MPLLETVFILQSHTFLKCQYFFVDEPSLLPLFYLVAKCSFISDFLFLDYFLLQFLLTSILLRGVFLSDLILISSVGQAEIREVGLWIPSCCLNWITVTVFTQIPVFYDLVYLGTFHTKDRKFASKMIL